MHSVSPGGFSRADAVAQGWISNQCPSQPGEFFASVDGIDWDNRRHLPVFLLACARWWGRSARELRSEINAHFAHPPDSGSDRGPECFPQDELLRVAGIDPPEAFRLRPQNAQRAP
jgi:hypothetical protein